MAGMKTCSRPGCTSEAVKNRGDRWLCAKHARFFQMQTNSRDRKLYAPPDEELDAMLAALDGFKCPACRTDMVWFRSQGSKHYLSIQHNRDGSVQFLCFPCNSKHHHFPEDTYYDHDPSRKKCSKCDTVKHVTEFVKNNKAATGRSAVCKACQAEYARKYQKAYRAAGRLPSRAAYYRKRRLLAKKAAILARPAQRGDVGILGEIDDALDDIEQAQKPS